MTIKNLALGLALAVALGALIIATNAPAQQPGEWRMFGGNVAGTGGSGGSGAGGGSFSRGERGQSGSPVLGQTWLRLPNMVRDEFVTRVP